MAKTATKTKQNSKKAAPTEERTATEVVLEMKAKHPKWTAAQISEATGIQKGTIYTAISRDKQRKAKAKAAARRSNKPAAPKQEVAATVDNTHMDQVDNETDAHAHAEGVAKATFFNLVSQTYLDKVKEAKDYDEAKKYGDLIIDLMNGLD